MNALLKYSALLIIFMLGSGLMTAIGATLHSKKVWIPGLIILILSCVASAVLLIYIGMW